MSIAAMRTVASVRKNFAAELTEAFLPAEKAADMAAIAGYNVMALALAKRDEAALPLTLGEDALRELAVACRHAIECQAAFRRVHALWPAIATDGYMFAPACPSPQGELPAAPLQLVG